MDLYQGLDATSEIYVPSSRSCGSAPTLSRCSRARRRHHAGTTSTSSTPQATVCGNYLTAPFVLTMPDVHTEEIEPWEEVGEEWRRLKAIFPEGFVTHRREQVYSFNSAWRSQ